MKSNLLFYLSALLMLWMLSGCELVGDIFRTGVWVGIILVVGVIMLVIALLRKLF